MTTGTRRSPWACGWSASRMTACNTSAKPRTCGVCSLADPVPSEIGVGAVLDTLAGAGPFFALDLDRPPNAAPADSPAWHHFRELLDDRAVLSDRVAAVRAAIAERAGLDLADIDPR